MATESDDIDQFGRCLCGAVEYRATGKIILNALCHCRACKWAFSCTPIHAIGLNAPLPEFTKGEDKIVVAKGHGKMIHGRCSECHVPLYQKPGEDYPFVAVFPATFVFDNRDSVDQKLPEKYVPKIHINYENRARDAEDKLPKFRKWPQQGEEMNNDGSLK